MKALKALFRWLFAERARAAHDYDKETAPKGWQP